MKHHDAGASTLRGTRLGAYDILDELGHGGMGTVYRAYDTRLKRDVALKVIPAGRYADAEQRQRLRREAENIAALEHSGIVRILDIGEHDHNLYLVLELLHPGGMRTFTAGRTVTPEWGARVLMQLAHGVHHAHQAGIVHRDIKPENILLAASDDQSQPWQALHETMTVDTLPQFKITDFGLAKSEDEEQHLTRTQMMLGTPDYMAPEQHPDNSERIGPAADIYALGVIFYELLTGQLPLKADTTTVQLTMLREADPLPPRSLNPAINRDLDTICLKCLMKNPAQRYASAQELADDLDLFLRGEAIRARSFSLWQKILRRARREPIAAAFVAVPVFGYAVYLAILLLSGDPQMLASYVPVTASFLVWVIATYLIQQIYQQARWRRLGEYLYATIPPIVLFFQMEGGIAGGIDPPVIAFYMLNIPVAVLIRPHPHMIWFETLLSLLSYLAILAVVALRWPDMPPPGGFPLGAVAAMLFMGFFMHLVLRRISA